MKKILALVFGVALALPLLAQDPTIDKGSGWLYFSGVPGSTPDESCCSEIAMNLLTREAYTWHRDSNEWQLLLAITQGLEAPVDDPGSGPKLFLNREDGQLYQWDGAAWNEVGTGGGGGGGTLEDGDKGDIIVSDSATVWNIDAGVVGATELSSTAVTPGSYTLTNLTVDADGRIIAASTGSIGSGTTGDMAVWNGTNVLTSQTDGKFIYDNNLVYGNRSSGTNTIWLNDSTITSVAYTAGQILIVGPSGEVTDTTTAAILSMIGALSGSGTSGRVPVRNGSTTMTDYNNFLYNGTSLSVATTNATYALEVGTGAMRIAASSAPAGNLGAFYVNNSDNRPYYHNGTAFVNMVTGTGTAAQNTYFSATGVVTGSSNWTYDGTSLHLTSGDIEIETSDRGIYNSAGNVGIEFDTSNPYLYAELGGSGNERYMEFELSGRIGKAFTATTPTASQFGVQAIQFSGMAAADTYLISERQPASNANHIRIIGAYASDANNGASIFVEPGGSVTNGSYAGVSGIFQLKVPIDKDSVSTVAWKAIEVSGRNKLRPTIHLFNMDTTQTGLKVLTMEGDTIKYRTENIGVVNTTTDGSGDVTVTHGMGITPVAVTAVPTGTTPWILSVHTIGATTFKIRFYDATGAAVTSTAVTATWRGRT